MQGRKRVYPAEKSGTGWLSGLLLVLSAAVLLSGFLWRGKDGVSITPVPRSTPIPLEEGFDETMTERELTLPSSVWYALQLGAFESEKAASELAAQFQQRGAAGFVWHDGRYRTLAAVYPLKEDAQNVRVQLQEKHDVESYLYQIDLPSIHLLLKGMAGQLDILEAAFLHANDLVAQLQSISMALDRLEISTDEAVNQLSALAKQMETVSLRLCQRFANPRHSTVETLIASLDEYVAFAAQLSVKDSSAALGMKIKHQTLVSLHSLKMVYNTLSNT